MVVIMVSALLENFRKVGTLSQNLEEYMTQLLLLGKFEYTGGPIFKVVLEC